jgi:hypothetical protein
MVDEDAGQVLGLFFWEVIASSIHGLVPILAVYQ